MGKYFIAGVGYGKMLDSAGNLITNATTLTDSGFNTGTSLEEVRGGGGNSLQGLYSHTSKFEVTLKDCLMDLMYVALQTGSTVTSGGDIYTTETITTTVANQITVTGTPVAFGNVGVIGWYTIVGVEGTTKISFTGSVASVGSLPIGSKVCVTYLIEDNSARVVEVLSNFIPSEVHLVFTLPLFKGGIDSTNVATTSQLGEWIVDVPRFKLDGALALATTASSSVGAELKGQALAYASNASCTTTSIYATITEVIYGRDEFANVSDIAIADADVAVKVGATSTIKVYKIFNDGTASSLVDNSKVSFVSATPSVATVGLHTGLVTGVSAGNSVITATITSKTGLTTVAYATVTV